MNNRLDPYRPRPKARAKVILPPGFSAADWAQLQKEAAEKKKVQVQKGAPPPTPSRITPSQVASHQKENDIWISLNGKVFDMTTYLPVFLLLNCSFIPVERKY